MVLPRACVSPKMHVLFVFHASPCPPEIGPGRRHYHLVTEALKHHEVSVLSRGAAVERKAFLREFGGRCQEVVFIDDASPRWTRVLLRLWYTLTIRNNFRFASDRRLQGELDRILAAQKIDIVYFSTLLLGFCRVPIEVPAVSDTHNVEHDYFRRAASETANPLRKLYYYLQAAGTRRDEIAFGQRCRAVFATSARDAGLLQEMLPGQRVDVIPNGIDLDRLIPSDRRAEPATLIFTGLMSYYANEHGIGWFLDRIFPLIQREVPSVRVLVVGARPPRWLIRRASEQIEVTGYVPDVKPYFARAQVCVVPLKIGGGTRVKVLEAMALRRPVVATSLGCEGLCVQHEKTALVADEPLAFAEATIRLLRDGDLVERITVEAYRTVQARYSWDRIGRKLSGVLEEVTQGTASEDLCPFTAADEYGDCGV